MIPRQVDWQIEVSQVKELAGGVGGGGVEGAVCAAERPHRPFIQVLHIRQS